MSAAEEGVLRFQGVSKSFGEQKVLVDVSFEVQKGRAFCLLGRSGVGKSVTLKLLIGLLRPDAGGVLVEGKRVPELPQDQLATARKRMGFLFQNAALFDSISLGENVALPLRRHGALAEAEIRDRAQSRLEEVGLGGQYHKMPAELSGGMRKRAGLARALALNPSVLLVDEPSAGLDPITSAEIDDLLVGLKEKETTMVVVTHNIPSARRVGDELGILHQGRILERGSAEELERSDEKVVREFMVSRSGG